MTYWYNAKGYHDYISIVFIYIYITFGVCARAKADADWIWNTCLGQGQMTVKEGWPDASHLHADLLQSS